MKEVHDTGPAATHVRALMCTRVELARTHARPQAPKHPPGCVARGLSHKNAHETTGEPSVALAATHSLAHAEEGVCCSPLEARLAAWRPARRTAACGGLEFNKLSRADRRDIRF